MGYHPTTEGSFFASPNAFIRGGGVIFKARTNIFGKTESMLPGEETNFDCASHSTKDCERCVNWQTIACLYQMTIEFSI